MVGNAADKARILLQEKERKEQKKAFESERLAIEQKSQVNLRSFGKSTSLEAVENAFKAETVGLVTREEFLEKRTIIASQIALEEKRKLDCKESERAASQNAKRIKVTQKLKLSFAGDDNDGVHDDDDATEMGDMAPVAVTDVKYATLGKDPNAPEAHLLPDKDREKQEESLRQHLAHEYAVLQDGIRKEPLEITYSYYNGSGHRRKIEVKKGDTIGTFLNKVQRELADEFREVRMSSLSNLMYVKEDIILPHTVTFYELIVNKARGRSGPLFHFDVQQHAVAAFDPRLQSRDTHAGKVVERHWYEKNKHVFPYNKWQTYDDTKGH